jgi:hypothetical protein
LPIISCRWRTIKEVRKRRLIEPPFTDDPGRDTPPPSYLFSKPAGNYFDNMSYIFTQLADKLQTEIRSQCPFAG